MKLIVAYDTSVFIEKSIGSVFETIVGAILIFGAIYYLIAVRGSAQVDGSASRSASHTLLIGDWQWHGEASLMAL